jgi:DNA-directed RNA polymerase subunit RPC12/RpoP
VCVSIMHFFLSVFGQIFHCENCEHDNVDLSEDEDGDFVCEECGHIIEQPAPAPEVPKGAGTVHICHQCGEENHNLDPDEDGDLVCRECGHVIPEEQEEAEVRPRIIYFFDPTNSHIRRFRPKSMKSHGERSRTNVPIASISPLILNQTRKETGFAKNVDVYYQKSTIVSVKAVDMKTSILHVIVMVSTYVRSVARNWK